MRIAVNTRLLLKNRLEGIGWFTYETLKRITRDHPEHEFIFLFDRPFSKEFIFEKNVTAVVAGPPTRHVSLQLIWFELVVPRLLKKYKADLFLSPDGYLSLNTNVPSIAVIHDLNFYHYPAQLPFLLRWYYNTLFPRFAKKSRRIATVSEYTKQDIVSCYGISPELIDVTHNGSNENYLPLSESQNRETRVNYTQGDPYFLFIGLIIPRKNLQRLMTAFDIFKERTGSNVRLLVVGEKKWWTTEQEAGFQTLRHKEAIHFVGRLNPNELSKVLSAALALTYVPVFEGFGIPILEAFASGTPVITSNVTSMPEVAGDAALLVDPFSSEAIAEKLELMYSNPALRAVLIAKGLERKKQFSWDLTAQRLWDCIAAV